MWSGSASGGEAQRPVVIAVVIWPDRCARICGGFHIIARAGYCLEALAAHGGLAGFTPPMTAGRDMPPEPALNASGSPGGGLAPRSRESRYVIRAGLTRMCVRDEKSG